MLRVIGIDPGLSGAIALYEPAQAHETVLFDIPTTQVQIGKSKRPRIDLHKLWTLCRTLAELEISLACLEEQQPFPRDSKASAHTGGRGYGYLEFAMVAAGIPWCSVSTRKWQNALGVRKGKDASRVHASRLFPESAHMWAEEADHNRAEAALIAFYAAHKVME